MSCFLAFDLGADSGRAFAGRLSNGRLSLEPIHRFAITPLQMGRSLRWDVAALWASVRQALDAADGPLASIGLDTWGCDYGLVDEHGDLIEAPWHYRDHRTDDVMHDLLQSLGASRVYGLTGVQFLPFNTLFQLVATTRLAPGLLERAHRLLTMPDLFNYRLTGRMVNEYTNATTTQCIDARSRTWAWPLIEEAGLPAHIFGPLVEPGTEIGTVRADLGPLAGTPVVAPACHDTGSAVAAIEARGATAFLSSGTWSLVGLEVAAPVITPRAAALNFTNEGGVCGTTRLLKNVAGLWLLQACRREWLRDDPGLSYEALVASADTVKPFGPAVDVDDPAFLNPDSMTLAIADACRRSGQEAPGTRAATTRTIFESLALKYRLVVDWLEELTGGRIDTIRVIGGGSQNALLNQLTANATGRTILAGPSEATALGNIAMQMVATRHVADLATAREIIDVSFRPTRFRPVNPERWDRHYQSLRSCFDAGAVPSGDRRGGFGAGS